MSNYIKRETQWLRLFREKGIEFVGEIQVDEAELDELCRVIGQSLNHSNGEDFIALLTVATVNLAYYSSKELKTNRFPTYVLERLHLPDNGQKFWEEKIGQPVVSLLEKYFQTHHRIGPGRYVFPIKQQAGVPASSEKQFISHFCDLLRREGYDYSDSGYQNYFNQISSPALNDFLQSDTGRRFCRDLARILHIRHRLGLFDAQAFPNHPRFRALVEKAWQSLQVEKPTIIQRLPQPKLILDLDKKWLAVKFAERAPNGNYIWDNGTRVGRRLFFLELGDFREGLKGWIHQPDGSTEAWAVSVWHPSDYCWAAFRRGDGSYVGQKEILAPGRYLLVVPEDISLPSTARIFGEYGWLNLPIRTDRSFVIWDCELPAGFEIPEIGLVVESDAGSCPMLGLFPDDALPFAHNVFIGRLPEVRIYDWSSDFTQRFFVLIEVDQQMESLTPMDDRFRYAPPLPSQGEIRIEPKGRTPRGFVSPALSYTLLPPEVRIEWPDGLLAIGEDAFIEFHPSQDFQVCWEDTKIKPSGLSRWCVPPEVEFFEGLATYQSRISFPVYGATHRFKISSELIKEQVLWRESFAQKSQIELHFSRQEIGQTIEIGLLHRFSLERTVRLSQVVPNSAMLTISTEEIRDALTDSSLTAAEIAIRLPPRRINEPSRLFASGVIYVNEEKLLESLRQDEALALKDLSEILPESIQKIVMSIEHLRTARFNDFNPQAGQLPKPFQIFIEQLAICRQVFDLGAVRTDLSLLADEKPREALRWVQDANELLADAQPSSAQLAADLRKRTPQDWSAVPFERWRKECRELEERLRQIKDWPTLIREWADHCRMESWDVAGNTQLGQMPGGATLTDGAKDYFYALERKANGQNQSLMNWFGAARSKFEQAQDEAGQGIILEIASVLLAMTFHHAGHQGEFKNKANSAIDLLSPQWNKLCRTLQHLQQLTQQPQPNDGTLGLADVSPHLMDINLEEAINE